MLLSPPWPDRIGGILAALVLALGSVATAEEARGVDDPTVSFGLASLSDWGTQVPLLDIARLMRPFFGFRGEDWESYGAAELSSDGYLDPAGYPLRIPPGVDGLRTIWAWDEVTGAQTRQGLYILTYEGTGAIELGGAARLVAEMPGSIVFENATGAGFWLDIIATDPAGQGEYIRAISLVRADRAGLARAGAVFDPDWLASIADARELRFLDWMTTNSGQAADHWADRPELGDASWTPRGAPVEIMVRLANEAGADPWFTMPHAADDEFIRQFALYVRDNLDPRLKVHVEYSNETWNAAFQQFHWLRNRAVADWGEGIAEDWAAIIAYHSKRATEVALIWEDVFGEDAQSRLVNVLGTQGGNTWMVEHQLAANAWAEREPESYVAPAEVFEEVAAATYFGGSVVSNQTLRAELITRAMQDRERAQSWLFSLLTQEGQLEDSLPAVLRMLAAQKTAVSLHGLRYAAYEGGQHVHHSFAVEGLDEDTVRKLDDFLIGFVRGQEMGALYTQLWDGWRKIGQGPFMHYTEMGAPSRWGSWGLLAHKHDHTPRSDFLLARQAEGGSWWGEGGGAQYLQGVAVNGTEESDQITGTEEEDYLVGQGGDDVIVASPGADGVNGGEGTDTYFLLGTPAEHIIVPEGAGYRVVGPMGPDYLIDVEIVRFSDGSTIAVSSGNLAPQ